MESETQNWLAALAKWTIVVILAAVALYVVYPKYYFSDITLTPNSGGDLIVGAVRCNRITGSVVFVIANGNLVQGK
jgi:hypothetical protein